MSRRDYTLLLRRKVRRALNSTWESFKLSNRKLMHTGWGSGIKRNHITKTHIKEEEML